MFYKIKSLSKGLDGLIVKGDEIHLNDGYGTYNLVNVSEIIDSNTVIGDRNVKIPMTGGGLWINIHNLEKIDDPGLREFASDNPYGKFLFDGHYVKGDIEVAYCRYERVITVSILELGDDPKRSRKTIYSENFDAKFFNVLNDIIAQEFSNDEEGTDLMFKLSSFKKENG
jgi:coenzyme F420-reducing hydrogenase delta subunit